MVKKILENPIVLSALICAFLFYLGIVQAKERNPFNSLIPKNQIFSATGTVCSNPTKSRAFGGTYKMDFFLEETESEDGAKSVSSGKIQVYLPTEIVESFYPGKLRTRSETNSGVLVENGAKLKLQLRLTTFSDGSFLATTAESLGFSSKFSHFRGLCRLLFKRLMYAWGNAGGLLLALLSGSREYTESVISDSFRDAGLSHILALSGMHLSLFGGLALAFGKRVATRRIADAIQLGAILFFVWFAGLSPSLFRAFLCSLILYLSSLLRMRRPSGISVLATSFLIHSMIFPGHLKEAAFLLSYTSLAGILILSETIKKFIFPKSFPRIRSSISESAAAQIFTSPISACIFGKIMPIGIVASVFASPLVVGFLYFGLFGIVLCLLLPFLSNPFNVIMNVFYKIITEVAFFFAHFPSIEVG